MAVPGAAGRILDSHSGEVMRRQTAGGGGHHGTAVKDRVGVVWGGMDVLHKCLCAGLFAEVVGII